MKLGVDWIWIRRKNEKERERERDINSWTHEWAVRLE